MFQTLQNIFLALEIMIISIMVVLGLVAISTIRHLSTESKETFSAVNNYVKTALVSGTETIKRRHENKMKRI